MKPAELVMIAGAGVGAWWLFSKIGPGAVAAPASLDDTALCQRFKPNWTQGQCATRLAELRAAATGARAKIDEILRPRAAWIAAGDMAKVAELDKAAAPWQLALQGHLQDYWNLTGRQLA